MARFHTREGIGAVFGKQGTETLAFTSGVSSAVSSAIPYILANYPSIVEIGEPGIQETEGTAGNGSVTLTVPSGKYWRLVALYHLLVTDATVANRAVVVKTRDSGDTQITATTHDNVAASTTAKRTTLFGNQIHTVGNRGVQAQGTLTMDTQPTADDTVTIDSTVFTWTADGTAHTPNEIDVGADLADAKTLFVTAVNAHPDLLTVVTAAAFSGDDCVLTAVEPGTAGNSIVTTETFTAGTNVFDAATLGTTTAGLQNADKVVSADYPTTGPYLGPGEDVNITVTNGVAGDTLDTYLVYMQFDNNPTA